MQYAAEPRSKRSGRTYRRREPEHTALYAVLQNELETFLSHAQSTDERIPGFVERELRAFLRCGMLAYGCARVHCDGCGHDRLVAFSCKGRGFCPSCGGKRMTRFAEHLIDHVLPVAPARQWVLTVPHRLRYRMAYDHDICRAVHRAFIRALQMSYVRRAAAAGILRGSTGAVTCIQRFGSALNLNVHFHTQALDGVFKESGHGRLTFYPLAPPTNEQVLDVLEDLTCRMQPILRRFGLAAQEEQETDSLANDSALLAAVYAGSILGRVALGPRRGHAPAAVGRDPRARGRDRLLRHHAQLEGFDLHASVSVPASARDRLEQLLRYCARPAISHDRLTLLPDGSAQLALKTPRFDGTTHIVLTAHELIERLVAVIPRPQKNLILYTGVLAARSKLRERARTYGHEPLPRAFPTTRALVHQARPASIKSQVRSVRPSHNSAWARLMRRAFDIDVLCCPTCNGRMRLMALIQQDRVAGRILRHLGMRDHAPRLVPARTCEDEYEA